MVSGSQSLSLQQLEEKKLMSFADNLAFHTQYIMVLWETWGGFELAMAAVYSNNIKHWFERKVLNFICTISCIKLLHMHVREFIHNTARRV